ncbi:hypothetical protein NXZ84_09250 [Mechercharimyces sp. CAU 1602]|nr:hypothetical protein [Mechercharimyces sp. CAU 1602]
MIRRWNQRYLRLYGKRVEAEITRVYIDYRLKRKGMGVWNTSSGQSPYVIEAHWVDPVTKQDYIFTSGYLWHDPSPYLESQIEVYIKEQNPHRYYMDCRSIEKLAPKEKAGFDFTMILFFLMAILIAAQFIIPVTVVDHELLRTLLIGVSILIPISGLISSR